MRSPWKGIKTKSPELVKTAICSFLLLSSLASSNGPIASAWAQSGNDSPANPAAIPGGASEPTSEAGAPASAALDSPPPSDTALPQETPAVTDAPPASTETTAPVTGATGTGNEAQLDAPPPATATSPSVLPEIRARTYPVAVNRTSKSAQVYLFDDTSFARPFPGRILLVKRDKQPVMAFRVLRTYPEQKQFAGKAVRKYPGIELLPAGEPLIGLEKISDLAPPAPTAQDKTDLNELESGFKSNNPVPGAGEAQPKDAAPKGAAASPSYDPELDAGSSPALTGGVNSEEEKDPASISDDEAENYDDDPNGGLVIEEVIPLDHYRNALSFQFGLLTNYSADGKLAFYAFRGGGLRYAFTLGHMIFLKRAHVQDSVAVEGGFFLYQAINYQRAGGGDAFTVMPLSGTVRYTINFDNKFGLFGYAGLLANRVLSVTQGSDTAKNTLSSTISAVGVGALINVGPAWDLRIDAGIDMFSVGLMLRF